jgi:chromate reductase
MAMAQFDVAVIVGSLRKGSFNRMVAGALVERAPASLSCRFVEIGALPLYNQDLDADPPAPWRSFRDEVRPLDAVLFVTPEYNRSVPGVLKNAIDVGSRPYGQSVWSKKPTAVVSASPSGLGAFGANHALRQSFVFLDMPAMQQPEAYISGAHKLFDEQGKLTADSTGEFFVAFMKAFADWVDLIRRAEAIGEIA